MVNLLLHHEQESKFPVANNGAKSPTATAERHNPSITHMRTDNHPMSLPTPSSNRNEARDQPPSASIQPRNDLEMICDYDRSVTQLYEMLESSQWNDACARCQNHPEEVHTWVIRRDANGKIRWKLLPLHAAIIFKAPLSLIEELLRIHPIAAAKRDDQGILPLHLAFRHKSNEAVIGKLLYQYPGGVIVKDHRERFPLDHGKDMGFSAKLMGLYAETFSKCQHLDTTVTTDGAEITSTYEKRMAALKDAYEARILALREQHTQRYEMMKIQIEEDAQREKEKDREEIVHLKGQLQSARESITGKNTSELEAEIRGLGISLGDATRELIALRKAVKEQDEQKETLVVGMRQSMKDQKALRDLCNKQKEQLVQAQKLREQLLQTLIQTENGKFNQISNEISMISENNIAQMEKLLNNISIPDSNHPIESVSRGLPRTTYQNTDNVQSDPHLTVENCKPSNTASWTEETVGDGDDISEITEISYAQPYGDR